MAMTIRPDRRTLTAGRYTGTGRRPPRPGRRWGSGNGSAAPMWRCRRPVPKGGGAIAPLAQVKVEDRRPVGLPALQRVVHEVAGDHRLKRICARRNRRLCGLLRPAERTEETGRRQHDRAEAGEPRIGSAAPAAAAGAMGGRAMLAVTGSVLPMTRPVVTGTMSRRPVNRRAVHGWAVHGRSMDWRSVNGAMDEAWMAPAMPAGGAAPAQSAPPGKATLVPARAAPSRIVPAVSPSAPDELRLFDGRGLRQRGGRREGADAKPSLRGKSELRDRSCHGERESELAKHMGVLRTTRLWTGRLNLR
jgi:hypothetical protein